MKQKPMTYEEALDAAVERLYRWHSHYIPDYQLKSIAMTVLAAVDFAELTVAASSHKAREDA